MKTVFIRAFEADVDDKAATLREAVRYSASDGTVRFEVDPMAFRGVPKSPFAYWTTTTLRGAFTGLRAFSSEDRIVKQGLATADDLRFLRLATEVTPAFRRARWLPFAKGGARSRFYFDHHLRIEWTTSGAILKAAVEAAHGNIGKRIYNEHLYFRPGLTWPRRTQAGLSVRALPAGCIFGDKGPAIFVDGNVPNTLLSLLALTNSRCFAALVELQMSFGSYEVGVIQRTPIPDLNEVDRRALATLGRRAWSCKRTLDTRTENSHAFTLPALLQVDGAKLSDRAEAWLAHVAEVESELAKLQAQVDDRCFELYGIDDAERTRIEQDFAGVADGEPIDGDDGDDAEEHEIDVEPMAASLLSWALGVAFGRFDLRLATGARALPPEPEPFDPLPVSSPGMLTGEDGLPLTAAPEGYPLVFPSDGVLVDDLGHPQDFMGRVSAVFEAVFGEQSSERLIEAESYLGRRNEDLRTWFAKRFFTAHVKRYSRSRRKAPIYWQLGTPSASYSVWCYCHRLDRDTLFRVGQDYVGPKVAHEEAKLNALRHEAGADPSSKQRRAIDKQERFVAELQAFKDEVERVAPLWNPNLDDGIIIHFSLLWRLVPHNRSWQQECMKVWDKLQQGDYDWAHLAMNLWPERVVPKCADDRSLAIAHGIESELWLADDEGNWKPREVGPERIGELIAARSSSAVKAALNGLLSAPVQGGGVKRRKRKRGGA